MVIPLKDARENAGLSQEKLGKLANSGRSTIVKLELGTLTLTKAWAMRLAPHLGIEPEQLWDGPPLPSAEELEKMIRLAVPELEPGATFGDFARVVASSLRTQLELYQAAGGFRPKRAEGTERDTTSPPPDPKTRYDQEASRKT